MGLIIGTLRGVRGSGVGDYTSLNRPYWVLVMGIKAPYPSKGPYELILHRTPGVAVELLERLLRPA